MGDKIQRVKIQFPIAIRTARVWDDVFKSLMHMLPRDCEISDLDYASPFIDVEFQEPVDVPDGWEHVLDALLDMVCRHYERENPTRVMWCAEHGQMPLWSKHDANMLGVSTTSDKEEGEPDWDSSTYFIGIHETEDVHGNNKYNPNRDALREESRARRALMKKSAKPYREYDGDRP